jgi:ClpP class serine protease
MNLDLFRAELTSTHYWAMQSDSFNLYSRMMNAWLHHPWIITEFDRRTHHPHLLETEILHDGIKENLITTTCHNPDAFDNPGEHQFIHVTPLCGPLTRAGAPCAYGISELADRFRFADNHPRVIGHLVILDTPGGDARANDLNALLAAAAKPVVGLIRGLNASKGVHISAFIPHVFAESPDSEVGSVGVYAAFEGHIHEAEYEGRRYVEIYDDSSDDKNLAFREAIQNKNYEPVKKELALLRDTFTADLKHRWPGLDDSLLHGKTVKAADAVGQLLDGIKSYDETVRFIFQLAGQTIRRQGVITPLGVAPGNTPPPRDEPSPNASAQPPKTDTNPLNQTYMTLTELQSVLGPDFSAETDDQGNVAITPEILQAMAAAVNSARLHAEQQEARIQALDLENRQLAEAVPPLNTGAATTNGNSPPDTHVVEGSILDGISDPAERFRRTQECARHFGLI